MFEFTNIARYVLSHSLRAAIHSLFGAVRGLYFNVAHVLGEIGVVEHLPNGLRFYWLVRVDSTFRTLTFISISKVVPISGAWTRTVTLPLLITGALPAGKYLVAMNPSLAIGLRLE